MIKKSTILVLLILLFVGTVIANNNDFFGLWSKKVTYNLLRIEELDKDTKRWIEGKQEYGVYLREYNKTGQGRKYIILSMKPLEYNYQVGKAYFSGHKLIIKITTYDASNDSDTNNKLIFEVQTKVVPEIIKLYIDNRESDFIDI